MVGRENGLSKVSEMTAGSSARHDGELGEANGAKKKAIAQRSDTTLPHLNRSLSTAYVQDPPSAFFSLSYRSNRGGTHHRFKKEFSPRGLLVFFFGRKIVPLTCYRRTRPPLEVILEPVRIQIHLHT